MLNLTRITLKDKNDWDHVTNPTIYRGAHSHTPSLYAFLSLVAPLSGRAENYQTTMTFVWYLHNLLWYLHICLHYWNLFLFYSIYTDIPIKHPLMDIHTTSVTSINFKFTSIHFNSSFQFSIELQFSSELQFTSNSVWLSIAQSDYS